MSHAQVLDVKFVSFDSLTEALKSLGWTVKPNSKIHTYSGDPLKEKVYPYVALNPIRGGYDIGIEKVGEIYTLTADLTFSPSRIVDTLGKNIEKLKEAYSFQIVKEVYGDYEVTGTNSEGTFIEIDDGL